MSSTVQIGSMEITSTDAPDAMLASLTPTKETDKQPRVTVKSGQAVEAEPEKTELSKAASELGKKGGEAAAAKKAELKAKPIPPEKEAKTEEPDEGLKAKEALDDEIGKAAPEEKKKLASDRVAEATREAAAAKRERDAIRAEKDRLSAELAHERAQRTAPAAQAKTEPVKAAPTVDDDPEPAEADFEQYGDYVKAAGRHAARQQFRELQQKAQEQAQRTHQASQIDKAIGDFRGRFEAAAEADSAFKDRTRDLAVQLRPSFVLGEGEQLGPMNVIADEIIKSDVAPRLMDYLVEHPTDLQRIAALRTPAEIGREMARLEGRLETASHGTSVSKPAVSKANPPVRPVTGTPHTAEPDPSGEVDLDTYAARRKAQRK